MNVYRKLRKEKGLTQVELSKILHVNQTTTSKWELDLAIPDPVMLKQLSSFYGVSVDYLLGRTDNPTPDTLPTATVKIPLLGNIAAGQPIEAIENVEDYVYISEDMSRHGTYFALKVKGNSMEPRIYEGDIAIIRHQGSVNSGEIAAVKVTAPKEKRGLKYRKKRRFALNFYCVVKYLTQFDTILIFGNPAIERGVLLLSFFLFGDILIEPSRCTSAPFCFI